MRIGTNDSRRADIESLSPPLTLTTRQQPDQKKRNESLIRSVDGDGDYVVTEMRILSLPSDDKGKEECGLLCVELIVTRNNDGQCVIVHFSDCTQRLGAGACGEGEGAMISVLMKLTRKDQERLGEICSSVVRMGVDD